MNLEKNKNIKLCWSLIFFYNIFTSIKVAPIASFLFLILGLSCIPSIEKKIENKIELYKLKKVKTIALCVIFFLIIIAIEKGLGRI